MSKVFKCQSCGASLDIKKPNCEYCGSGYVLPEEYREKPVQSQQPANPTYDPQYTSQSAAPNVGMGGFLGGILGGIGMATMMKGSRRHAPPPRMIRPGGPRPPMGRR